MKATVIIPTIGRPELKQAVQSVLNQTYENVEVYVVCDGKKYIDIVFNILSELNFYIKPNCKFVCLDDNVGSNNYFGHRIYAAFSHLVNSDYILFLDEDNWYEPNHIETQIKNIEENNLDWSYSLRNIVDSEGKFICQDKFESVGKYNQILEYDLIDTNCYCLKKEVVIKSSWTIHGTWGFDRVFYNYLKTNFNNFDITGEFTVNYRLGSNENLKPEFFLNGNSIVQKYPLPWK